MFNNVRGVENEYEDNPEDSLPITIVPENKGSFPPRFELCPDTGSIGTMSTGNTNEANGNRTNGGVGVGSGVGVGAAPASFSIDRPSALPLPMKTSTSFQLDDTRHYVRGKGVLASKRDVHVAPDEFAAGCKLLQASALGDSQGIIALLKLRPFHINFRDYDRRTALHVAASEGQIAIVSMLIERFNSPINRSDRW